jgi:hypothetical protein
MFDALEYSKSRIPQLPEIKAIYSCSGLSDLEGLLQNLRNPASPVLVVEDSSDGYLDLVDGNFSNEYNTVYILERVKLNDSADRRRAQKLTFNIAMRFFRQLKADSVDFGDIAYGFDSGRIDYSKLGPVGNGFYGYSFSFVVKNENFSTV